MTTFHLHQLDGCAPAPLAHYLKALGILRIITEQGDRSVRGWWANGAFRLLTTLDKEALQRFFLEEYAPTPFLSPWNKGSGFFAENDPGIGPIERSCASRFAPFRRGIAAARRPLDALAAADAAVRSLKDRTKVRKGMTSAQKRAVKDLTTDERFKAELAAANRRFKDLKADLFRPCELDWRGPHREWMNTAVVLGDQRRTFFPSLLGTGGNDGRIDFTNNAMQRIADLFDLDTTEGRAKPAARSWLRDTLWQDPAHRLVSAAVGQFLPGNAGGANSTTGPEGESRINPWDFLLMLEGSILFSSRSTRRLDASVLGLASAPFAVRSHSAGYGTAGSEKADRGEQWMPLWEQPVTLADLQAMIGEARVQVGRVTAHRPLDVARAVARLGVARGIRQFTRFGYLERNGQSKLAVPLGTIDVRHRPRARLVDEIAPWLDHLRRLSGDKLAPARFVQAERHLAHVTFAVLTHDDTPDRWQAVLMAATSIESLQLGGTAIKAGPIPALSPDWVEAANDGSAEWRLSRALGSAAAGYDEWQRPIDPVRHHWLPLEKGARRFRVKDGRLLRDPRVVVSGRDAISDFAGVIGRRLVEGTMRGQRNLPMVAGPGCGADLADLACLISGRIDLDRVSLLARAFMAVRWQRAPVTWPSSAARPLATLEEAWVALRLAFLPWPLQEGVDIPADQAILRRLVSQDPTAAVDLALSRLRAAGIRLPIRCAVADAFTSRLWAAALAFPIDRTTARALTRNIELSNQRR